MSSSLHPDNGAGSSRISQDPVYNAIYQGICRDIDITIENKCWRAAVILIFAGIDAMAHLGRPTVSKFNEADNFKNWVERYFHLNGHTTVSSEEWWAARNAIVHTYGAYARAHSKRSDLRVLSWMVGANPSVLYNPKSSTNLVLIDIPAMKDAFKNGVNRFVVDVFNDNSLKGVIDARLAQLLSQYERSDNPKVANYISSDW